MLYYMFKYKIWFLDILFTSFLCVVFYSLIPSVLKHIHVHISGVQYWVGYCEHSGLIPPTLEVRDLMSQVSGSLLSFFPSFCFFLTWFFHGVPFTFWPPSFWPTGPGVDSPGSPSALLQLASWSHLEVMQAGLASPEPSSSLTLPLSTAPGNQIPGNHYVNAATTAFIFFQSPKKHLWPDMILRWKQAPTHFILCGAENLISTGLNHNP